jgi:hypothetical protein
MDPLLIYPVILPKTIPVGVSNDLMFAEKGHPLLQQTINNLVTFDHSWVLNYPTVMFSTGPMFLSAQYGLYTASHPTTSVDDVRILPRSMYGKNAKEGQAPHSFFSHFYGSSWHADDAAFIGFLGSWGKVMMWVGLAVLIVGVVRLPSRQRRYSLRRMGGYEVLFPRWSHRTGRLHLHLGGWSGSSTQPPSPDGSSAGSSPIETEVPVLHLPFNVRPPSPSSLSDAAAAVDPYAGRTASPIVDAFYRIRNRMVSITGAREEVPRSPIRSRRPRHSRGVLFFLPAIFTQPQDIELAPPPPPSRISAPQPHISRITRASQLPPPEKSRYHEDVESVGDIREDYLMGLHPDGMSTSSSSRSSVDDDAHLVDLTDSPPPPLSRNGSSRSRSTPRPLISWD